MEGCYVVAFPLSSSLRCAEEKACNSSLTENYGGHSGKGTVFREKKVEILKDLDFV
jgi:hypothetical protein